MPRRNKPIIIIKQTRADKPHTKRIFNSKKEAEDAAELGMLEDMSLSLRVYKCDRCHGWHLTSTKD